MSFLGSLFGQDSKRYAQEANTNARNNLTTGYNTATGLLTQNRQQGLDTLNTGYNSARDTTNTGYNNARDTTNTFYNQARGDLNNGYNTASTNIQDYGRRAIDTLNPYVQSGYNNQALIDRLNGVGGREGQTQGYAAYQELNGPLVAARDAKINADMAAAANARGQLNAGKTALAVARASSERAATDYQNYLGNLNTSANRGAQAASQTANINQNIGSSLADIEARRGQGLAGLSTDQGNRLSSYDVGRANDLSRLSTGLADRSADLINSNGNAAANLTSGYYNALAGNDINLGSAQAQASQNGINNMLGIGSLAINALTPGKAGISPLGNLYSGMNGLFGRNTNQTYGNSWQPQTVRA